MELVKNLFQRINTALSKNDVVTLDTQQLDIISLMQQRGFVVTSIQPLNCNMSTETQLTMPMITNSSTLVGGTPFYSSNRKFLLYGDIQGVLYSDGAVSDEFAVNCYQDRTTTGKNIFYLKPRATENKCFTFSLKDVVFSVASLTQNTAGLYPSWSFNGYVLQIQ